MKKRNSFYITTAIDYPSGEPHIGHAYEKIIADTIARWQRAQHNDVFLLTGTDEHGQKIEKYARARQMAPQEFVEQTSAKFMTLCRALGISHDDFIRTTEPRHTAAALTILRRVMAKGDIYKDTYKGYYCVDCEAFFLERDLKNGMCPVHDKPAEWIEEEGYFFAMSKYQQAVVDHIRSHDDFIVPKSRRNEMINRIEEGVRDLSISRSNFTWGIPFPDDPKHIVFVWFDALINYVSALGYPDGERFARFWPADIHVIGKDILWFHTMVWMSILLAADIPLPRAIFVHGFINLGGEKISKSKGVSVDTLALIEKYGADSLRYFFLREIAFGEDGNFSEDALIRRMNSDLANDLGNLVYRSLSMLEKYVQGAVPREYHQQCGSDVIAQAQALKDVVAGHMREYDFSAALAGIWEVIGRANKFVEETKPWNLAKENKTRELNDFLFTLVAVITAVCQQLEVFMPQTAEKIKAQFAGGTVRKGAPLFPRIEI